MKRETEIKMDREVDNCNGWFKSKCEIQVWLLAIECFCFWLGLAWFVVRNADPAGLNPWFTIFLLLPLFLLLFVNSGQLKDNSDQIK